MARFELRSTKCPRGERDAAQIIPDESGPCGHRDVHCTSGCLRQEGRGGVGRNGCNGRGRSTGRLDRQEDGDQVAPADLRRTGTRRARDQALHRGVQQGGEWRDGHRALFRRPARADGRAVPCHAGRHDRCGAERRRLHRSTDRHQGIRRLFPVRHALQSRRPRAVPQVRPERDLAGSLRRSRERDLAQLRLLGPLPLQHRQADHQGLGPEGPQDLHLPDRREIPHAFRRGARHAAVG